MAQALGHRPPHRPMAPGRGAGRVRRGGVAGSAPWSCRRQL